MGLAILLMVAGAVLRLGARRTYAFALALLLLGFEACLAGRAHGMLKASPSEVLAPTSLVVHGMFALVFLVPLSVPAIWRVRSAAAGG